jgi:phage regulator Rha-like protein
MFQLTWDEVAFIQDSRSQFATLNKRGKNTKYLPRVFTEHGLVMLAAILNTEVAINASILIVKTFNKLREMISNHEELRIKIEELEKEYDARFDRVDVHVQSVFQAFKEIKKLLKPPKSKKTKIGFIR